MGRANGSLGTAVVLGPHMPDFRSVREFLLQPALERAGFEVFSPSLMNGQEGVLAEAVGMIGQADLAVVDLTLASSAVMYYLGLCHGLGTPTLLIAQSVDDVPFDLRGYRIELYSTRFDLAPRLSEAVYETASAHRAGRAFFGSPVTDYLGRLPDDEQRHRSGRRALLSGNQTAMQPIPELANRVNRTAEALSRHFAELATFSQHIVEAVESTSVEHLETQEDPARPTTGEARRRVEEYLADYAQDVDRTTILLEQATDELIDAGGLMASVLQLDQIPASDAEHFRYILIELLDALTPLRGQVAVVPDRLKQFLDEEDKALVRALVHIQDRLSRATGVLDTLAGFIHRTLRLLADVVER